MKEILQFYANKLSASSLSLKKKSLLVDKPWAYIDENGVLMKLIFRSNRTVIIAQNGKVTEGEWEYIGATKNLLFGNGQDKFLLKEAFLDPNVLVMKKDGTDRDFIALANEDVVPDYDINSYLHKLYIERNNIYSLSACDGYAIDVHVNSNSINTLDKLIGFPADISSESTGWLPSPTVEGRYVVKEGKYSVYVRSGKIDSVYHLRKRTTDDGKEITIEVPNDMVSINSGCLVKSNSPEPLEKKIITKDGCIYIHDDGIIQTVGKKYVFHLKEGHIIDVEYLENNSNESDKYISHVEPIDDIPNGKYHVMNSGERVYIVDRKLISKREFRAYMRAIKKDSQN